MVSVPDHTMEEVPLEEEEGEDSMEYVLLMSYAQRSLSASKYSALQEAMSSQRGQTPISNGKAETASGEDHKTKRKKKRWPKTLTPACLRPQKYESQTMEEGHSVINPEEEKARNIVSAVQRILRRIKKEQKESSFRFHRVSSVQYDGEDEDELIAKIVRVLRDSGDRLNDQITEDRSLKGRMKEMWSYGFYKKVTDSYLMAAVPKSETEEEQQASKIALCLHATTALTMLENQPMNKVLGFGVRYLKENYSPWIQSRGGWEKAMRIQDEEEIE